MSQGTGSRTLAWVVLVAAAAACFWVAGNTSSIRSLRAELAKVNEQVETLNNKFTQATSARDDLTSRSDLDAEVATLREKIGRLEDVVASGAASDELADEGVIDMNEMVGAMTDATSDSDEDDEGAGLAAMFSKMFEGEKGKKMAEYSARMAADMQYGDFFGELQLEPETEQEVRDIIIAHLTEQMTKGFEKAANAEDGQFDPTAMEDMADEGTDALRAELADVLSPNQLSVWDEYEATKEERLLTKQYDMQLGMLAPGLTPESRELATDILVDEILVAKEARKQNPDPKPRGIQAAFDQQRQATANTRDRLTQYLDDSQMKHFDRYIEQQEAQFEVAAQMFGAMTEEKEEKE